MDTNNVWEIAYKADHRKHHHRCLGCNRIIQDGEQAVMGRRCGRGTDRKAMVGWLKARATYLAFQAVAGQPRMHLDTFSQTIGATGRWVARVAGHATAVIDGAIHDTSHPRLDACVYCAWMIHD